MQKTPYKNPKKILAQIWRTLKRKISATCCFQLVTLTLAEREGFEPPVPLGTTVFKTVVIDHSTISPCGKPVCS